MAIFYHLDGHKLLRRDLIIWFEALPPPEQGASEVYELARWFPEGVTRFGLSILKGLACEGHLKRETTLESVRREFYPDRPSRYTSVFACKSPEDIIRFHSQFDYDGPIWKVDATEGFKADVNLFWQRFGDPIDYSHAYWTQTDGDPPQLFEYLLKPPVTVIEDVAWIVGDHRPHT